MLQYEVLATCLSLSWLQYYFGMHNLDLLGAAIHTKSLLTPLLAS